MTDTDPVIWDAAVKNTNEMGYGGSVEALGQSQAFYFGAMNAGSSSDIRLIQAFIEGLKFGKGHWG